MRTVAGDTRDEHERTNTVDWSHDDGNVEVLLARR